MSEMIERVARRLAQKITEPGADPESRMPHCMQLAKEAVEEMLRPTDKMRKAGWEKLREKNDIQTRLGNSLVGVETPVYEAMILAALA